MFLSHLSRIVASMAAGAGAGVLGFTGLRGFLTYFIVSALQIFLIFALRLRANTLLHFTSISAVYSEGLFHSLLVRVILLYFKKLH